MRRLVTLVLVGCFVLLGSGAVLHLHALSHQHATNHGECQLCIQLQQPLAEGPPAVTIVGAIVPAGVVAAAADPIFKPAPVEQTTCRGPPLRSTTR